MNAISWILPHIAGHWLLRPKELDRYNFRSTDPTPPSLEEARKTLETAKTFSTQWLTSAGDELFAHVPPENVDRESVGTGLLRTTLHTWFHAGEVNAIRQMLGHAEIGFVGDIQGKVAWHSSPDGSPGSFRPEELARFAASEFERGLEGLSDADARTRLDKSDGTKMNAIAWTIGHIAMHWHWAGFLIAQEPLPDSALAFFGAGADPTPRPLDEMCAMLAEARAKADVWLPNLTDDLLSSKRDVGPQAEENLGTQLARAVLQPGFIPARSTPSASCSAIQRYRTSAASWATPNGAPRNVVRANLLSQANRINSGSAYVHRLPLLEPPAPCSVFLVPLASPALQSRC